MECGTIDMFPPYAGEVYQPTRPSPNRSSVSPIRGGSLLRTGIKRVFLKSFPHTRGKFTENSIYNEILEEFPPYAGEVYLLTRRKNNRIRFPPYAGEVYQGR